MRILFTTILFLSLLQANAQVPSLKISSNKRFFQTSDGKPFFWLGDTGWLLFIKCTREEALQYLDDRKEKGFNVIQAMLIHDITLGVNAYGDSSIHKQDVSKPVTTAGKKFDDRLQYDYWDHVDYIIEEDSNNHRMYAVTTKDFMEFSDTKLFLDPKFSVIDAVIVKRAVKDYVLVLKDNTRPERNIKVAFSDSPMGPWKNISKPFTDNFTEGPSVVKVKDDWLIYYDSYRKKIYEASATKDFVHFTNITDKVRIPEGHKHGTIVTVKQKFVKQLKSNLQR